MFLIRTYVFCLAAACASLLRGVYDYWAKERRHFSTRLIGGVIILWMGSAVALNDPAIASTQTRSLIQMPLQMPSVEAGQPTPTDDLSSAATLFEQNCAGCHINGGNIIRRGKNLKKRAMQRNGYGDVDAIASIITNGKGNMSAYGDRLSAEEISAIALYVHQQSETGWRN